MDVVIVILFIALFLNLYILIRNDKVYYFKLMLTSMAFDYHMRHIGSHIDLDSKDSAYIWFVDKHSYKRLLFSIKPLKLKYWFTEEELNRIKS